MCTIWWHRCGLQWQEKWIKLAKCSPRRRMKLSFCCDSSLIIYAFHIHLSQRRCTFGVDRIHCAPARPASHYPSITFYYLLENQRNRSAFFRPALFQSAIRWQTFERAITRRTHRILFQNAAHYSFDCILMENWKFLHHYLWKKKSLASLYVRKPLVSLKVLWHTPSRREINFFLYLFYFPPSLFFYSSLLSNLSGGNIKIDTFHYASK